MLSEKELISNAYDEIINIFGKTYLRNNFVGSLTANGFIGNGVYQVFLGIKTDDEVESGHDVSAKGWAVYALIHLNTETGEIIRKEYILE